jgi:hypothetical protein
VGKRPGKTGKLLRIALMEYEKAEQENQLPKMALSTILSIELKLFEINV